MLLATILWQYGIVRHESLAEHNDSADLLPPQNTQLLTLNDISLQPDYDGTPAVLPLTFNWNVENPRVIVKNFYAAQDIQTFVCLGEKTIVFNGPDEQFLCGHGAKAGICTLRCYAVTLLENSTLITKIKHANCCMLSTLSLVNWSLHMKYAQNISSSWTNEGQYWFCSSPLTPVTGRRSSVVKKQPDLRNRASIHKEVFATHHAANWYQPTLPWFGFDQEGQLVESYKCQLRCIRVTTYFKAKDKRYQPIFRKAQQVLLFLPWDDPDMWDFHAGSQIPITVPSLAKEIDQLYDPCIETCQLQVWLRQICLCGLWSSLDHWNRHRYWLRWLLSADLATSLRSYMHMQDGAFQDRLLATAFVEYKSSSRELLTRMADVFKGSHYGQIPWKVLTAWTFRKVWQHLLTRSEGPVGYHKRGDSQTNHSLERVLQRSRKHD